MRQTDERLPRLLTTEEPLAHGVAAGIAMCHAPYSATIPRASRLPTKTTSTGPTTTAAISPMTMSPTISSASFIGLPAVPRDYAPFKAAPRVTASKHRRFHRAAGAHLIVCRRVVKSIAVRSIDRARRS